MCAPFPQLSPFRGPAGDKNFLLAASALASLPAAERLARLDELAHLPLEPLQLLRWLLLGDGVARQQFRFAAFHLMCSFYDQLCPCGVTLQMCVPEEFTPAYCGARASAQINSC